MTCDICARVRVERPVHLVSLVADALRLSNLRGSGFQATLTHQEQPAHIPKFCSTFPDWEDSSVLSSAWMAFPSMSGTASDKKGTHALALRLTCQE